MILCVCPNPSVDKYVWLNNFSIGETNRISKEKQYPGGKGIHVALALKEMGEVVNLLGFWGGPTGQWIKSYCEKFGIICYGPETEEWTRTCITFKSDGQYNDTEFLGVGPQIGKSQFEEFLDVFKRIAGDSRCITLSGSWPKNVPDDAYAQLVKIASEKGIKSFLDCSGEQLKNALIQKPFTVHVNKSEGRVLYTDSEVHEISQALLSHCTYAAVTAGADGLFYSGLGVSLHASCRINKVYSAVGSGDCLVAGLAYAYVHKMENEQTLRVAVACGAANCLREDLGMLYKSDVEKLIPQAIVNVISKK